MTFCSKRSRHYYAVRGASEATENLRFQSFGRGTRVAFHPFWKLVSVSIKDRSNFLTDSWLTSRYAADPTTNDFGAWKYPRCQGTGNCKTRKLFPGRKKSRTFTHRCVGVRRRNRSASLGSRAERVLTAKRINTTDRQREWAYGLLFFFRPMDAWE